VEWARKYPCRKNSDLLRGLDRGQLVPPRDVSSLRRATRRSIFGRQKAYVGYDKGARPPPTMSAEGKQPGQVFAQGRAGGQGGGSPRPGGSAILLRRKLRVGIELEESTLLTTECSDWYTFSTWRFRVTYELFLWLACMPVRDHGSSHGIIRHKPLDHLSFAFGHCILLFVIVVDPDMGCRRLCDGGSCIETGKTATSSCATCSWSP